MIPFVLVVSAIAVAGALIWWSIAIERKRQRLIEETAESLGLSFKREDDTELRQRFSAMKLFQQGHTKKSGNCMVGDSGEVRISIFDYTYTTGSGKHKHTRRMTITAMESGRLKIPAFSLRPEGLFDKLTGVLGFKDIDFDDDKAFSAAVYLTGENETGIRVVFNRELRDWFVANPGISVEAKSGQLICYRANTRAKAEDYPGLLQKTYEVFGLIVDR